MVLKAYHPATNKVWYFVDKNLPFGASSSCKIFQDFSDGLAHIVEYFPDNKFCLTNYLDDYIFLAESEEVCNQMMNTFIEICSHVGCPLATEKTEFAANIMVFLGVLLNGLTLTLSLPKDKIDKALLLLNYCIHNNKATIHFIQRLTGTLNFLNRVIIPGRTFTRRMYNKLKLTDKQGQPLKQHHHVNLDVNFVKDCQVWKVFLQHATAQQLCRPFIDIDQTRYAEVLNFYSDASMSIKHGGLGAVYNNSYIVAKWNTSFLLQEHPSIEFLELFALCAALLTWGDQPELCNTRIGIWCDNTSVRDMINDLVSHCNQCMKLIKLIALENIKHNRRVFVFHV